MSNSTKDLAGGAIALLRAPGALRAEVPIIRRQPRQPSNEIEEEIAKQIICIVVLPPFATSALPGVPFVFYDGAELRLRIIEQPKLNNLEVDAYDLADDIATALHWTNPGNMLAHPLELALRPFEMVEDPETRIIDVVFKAVFQLNPQPE